MIYASKFSNSSFNQLQVVLERPSLRPGGSKSNKNADDEAYQLHVAQLVVLAVLLTAV